MKKTISIFIALCALVSCTQQAKKDTDAGQDWIGNSVVYELNTRQLTPEGTFKAAEAVLPTLKEMGVDIVWVMPIYPIGELGRKGTLGSYYAIKDYCDVNPEFGTLEDFDHFVEAVHESGMKIVIDWVANHTSPDHPWVTEKPAEWYVRDSLGKTIVEYDWTDIAKLNYDCPDVRQEMEKCMRFWLDRGIDGFRCDVAYKVPQDFWTSAISSIRASYDRPLYFLAEGEESWLHEAGFDATYAWKLHHLLNGIAQGKADADSLAAYLKWNDEEYPDASRLSFTSNHDENSWSGTEFDRMGEAWKAMTVLCWTLPASQPLIYTGQEIGYDHSFEFFEKDNIPAYKTNSFTDFYERLAELKHSHPALSSGSPYEVLSLEDNTIRFRRTFGSDEVSVSVQLESPWEWSVATAEDRIDRIEPPCWWTGMTTGLQLMVQGEGISEYSVTISGPAAPEEFFASTPAPSKFASVKEVHKAESANYLFVDVDIAGNAQAGVYWLTFTNGDDSFSVPYEIGERRAGSAERQSFSKADAIYLIMPDRFSNGDPSNDNTSCTSEKADYSDVWSRHGGDIQGIEDHLDYIADLGFTAIWNTPLLEDNEEQGSYHGYACTDYYNIDSRFGSNRKYREFVRKAHEHGLKVIMDVVTNHCGDKHWWMSDLPFADWVHQWPEYTHSNCSFSVQNDPYASEIDKKNMEGGWFDTSMVDMNLDNPFTLKYFQQWAVWWTEWADLDGFRVDTYPYNEKEPMSRWCAAVRAEYPGLNIVGEVWTNNVPQLAYWQKDNPNKDGFNSNLPSIMDFPLQSAICSGINTDKESWDNGITKVYDAVANDLYYHDLDNMMIFPGNHDTERIGDVVGHSPAKMKIVMALMATLRGYPQIYAGDELMVVSEDQSQPSSHGGLRVMFPDNWESDAVMKDLHDHVSKLLNWRKGSAAVQGGDMKHYLSRDNTYAYFRSVPEETVFVYINNNDEPREIPWSDYSESTEGLGSGKIIVGGAGTAAGAAGSGAAAGVSGEEIVVGSSVTVAPKTALVVEFRK